MTQPNCPPASPSRPAVSRARTPWAPLLAALSALAMFGCASEAKQEPITSSQTHWLKQCESSSECGDLQCACGLCTQACDAQASCEDLGERAACAPTDGVDACSSSAPSNICVQGCANEDDCGGSTSCVDGACVPSNEPDPVEAGTSDPTPPAGVRCDAYPACDVDTPCSTGECFSFAECGGALCIDGTEACELSCPDPDSCVSLDSYPAQLACEGKVPAIPPEPAPAPEGITCSDYFACGVEQPCAQGECVMFQACGSAICIEFETACELSCPEPEECMLLESFPAQLACEGQVAPQPGEPQVPPSLDSGVSPPPTPADAGSPQPDAGSSTAPGVNCAEHPTCGADIFCEAGQSCIALNGCEQPICIASAEACELSCPDPTLCSIAESYPEQLFCDGFVPGYGPSAPPPVVADAGSADAGVDAGFVGAPCGDTVCGFEELCCDACLSQCVSIFVDIACPQPTECEPQAE